MGHTPDNVTFVASMTLKTNKQTLGTFGSPTGDKTFLIAPSNGQENRGY